jgi:fatty acid desaturase
MESIEIPKRIGLGKYRLPDAIRPHIPQLTKTNALVSCAAASGNLLVLVVIATILARAPWTYWFWLVWAIIAVRSLRALENLGGHEGSHGNWMRRNPRLNDRLANAFAGYWVLLSAQGFRKTHSNHHRDFNGPGDPCLPRFVMLGLAAARRKGWGHFLVEMLRHYPGYVRQYWRGYSGVDARQVVRGAILHGLTMCAGNLLLPGFALAWCLAVLVPFCVVLPFMRMFAESEEHLYDGCSEAEDTFDNGSFLSRWLTHPAGDAHHWVHHVLTSVPHWKMHRAHLLFLKLDPLYRGIKKRR